MMLALLLSRAGIEVTVLEKHADFLRDFRGDTVHASTLGLLDELGLADAFSELDHQLVDQISVRLDTGTFVMADMTALPGRHQHIAMAPQAEFLEMLHRAASAEPTYRLLRNAEAVDLIWTGTKVSGVRYTDVSGKHHQLSAALVVACDGRNSLLRSSAGLKTKHFGAPIDVWWFALPKHPGDPQGLRARVSTKRLMITLDRGDYYQCGYLIGKGTDHQARDTQLSMLRDAIAEMLPHFADRLDAIASWDDVKLLDVRLNRLSRWHVDGALFIGDAAHAMSPLGGVGVNLAIADAVATARILAQPLLTDTLSVADLAKVQHRRLIPTVVCQRFQRAAHRNVSKYIPGGPAPTKTARTPLGAKLMTRYPKLRQMAGYGMAIGLMPEHAPAFARPHSELSAE